MVVEIIDHTSQYKDAPVRTMERIANHHVWQLTHAWPGGVRVAKDLRAQGFYIELVDRLPEAPGAMGYHSVDGDGRPYSKVAAAPSLDSGSDWLTGDYSVLAVIEHEWDETACNPLINLWVDRDRQAEVAREVNDPVQDQHYRRHGGDNTNFVLPSWFNPWGKPPFDFMGLLTKPFELSAGGYCIVRTPGGERDEWHAVREEGPNTSAVPRFLTRAATLLGA